MRLCRAILVLAGIVHTMSDLAAVLKFGHFRLAQASTIFSRSMQSLRTLPFLVAALVISSQAISDNDIVAAFKSDGFRVTTWAHFNGRRGALAESLTAT